MQFGQYNFNQNTPIAFLSGARVSFLSPYKGLKYSHGLLKDDTPIVILSSKWSAKISDVTLPIPIPRFEEVFQISLKSEDSGLNTYLEVKLDIKNKKYPIILSGNRDKKVKFQAPANIESISVFVKVFGAGTTILEYLTWENIR